MDRVIDRLKKQHRRLNSLIDSRHFALGQSELKSLKRLRLKVKDRLVQLQRRLAQATP